MVSRLDNVMSKLRLLGFSILAYNNFGVVYEKTDGTIDTIICPETRPQILLENDSTDLIKLNSSFIIIAEYLQNSQDIYKVHIYIESGLNIAEQFNYNSIAIVGNTFINNRDGNFDIRMPELNVLLLIIDGRLQLLNSLGDRLPLEIDGVSISELVLEMNDDNSVTLSCQYYSIYGSLEQLELLKINQGFNKWKIYSKEFSGVKIGKMIIPDY